MKVLILSTVFFASATMFRLAVILAGSSIRSDRESSPNDIQWERLAGE